MTNNYLTPKETADYITELSVTKARMKIKRRFLLSFMGGLFIALGGQGFLTMYSDPFLRAAVFPVGLMLIVLVGGELFTGNCLMTFGCLNKKISIKELISSIMQVWFGNLVGSLAVALLVYYSGMYKPDSALATTIATVAKAKVSLSFMQIMFKGILCNILVALGVWFAYTAKDTIGKLFGCWFPVMLFVLCGYEHCVANMFFLPLGALVDSSITITQIIGNLIPSTIGNFIGGGLLLPVLYYNVYHKQ